MKKRNKLNSLMIKFPAMILAIILVCTIPLGVFAYTVYRNDSIEKHKNRAVAMVQALAVAIDPDEFLGAIASDEKNDYYNWFQLKFNRAKADLGASFLFAGTADERTGLTTFMEALLPHESHTADLNTVVPAEVFPPQFYAAQRNGVAGASDLMPSGVDDSFVIAAYAPIFNQNMQPIGVVGVTIDANQVLIMSNDFARTMFIIVVIIIVVVLWIPSIYTWRSVARPLAPIASFFHRAAVTGDVYLTPAELNVVSKHQKRNDEVGILSASAILLSEALQGFGELLDKMASGDMTAEAEILTEKDILSISLKKIIDNLNEVLSEINTTIKTASIRISSESRQIADSLQTFADSSIEQASTVSELSENTGDIAEKTKANADMANKASTLANTIKDNAEKSSRQMDDMMTAVNEINQASQSISKVIKVIDDIAFQTNILALNAAVEAARAGQHGKGFAVVAEEVRNLAAKSAEAAKDTGAWTSDSMEKAAQGARIANETATSLAEIVSGISESSKIISEIAKASETQTSGITRINSGIDQVATIVNQNSGIAQESAAVAHELSGQSALLENLVERFKLKTDNNSGLRRLPSAH